MPSIQSVQMKQKQDYRKYFYTCFYVVLDFVFVNSDISCNFVLQLGYLFISISKWITRETVLFLIDAALVVFMSFKDRFSNERNGFKFTKNWIDSWNLSQFAKICASSLPTRSSTHSTISANSSYWQRVSKSFEYFGRKINNSTFLTMKSFTISPKV